MAKSDNARSVRLFRCRDPHRSAFTRVELLVTLFTLAVLFSLVLPSMQWGRRSPRKIQCLNNLKQLGLAASNHASAKNGNLPYLLQQVPFESKNARGTTYHSWCIQLLPYLDQAALAAEISKQPFADAKPAWTTEHFLSVFRCVDDLTEEEAPGALSYAANAGFATLDGFQAATGTTGQHLASYDWDGDGTVWNGFGNSDPDDVEIARAFTAIYREGGGDDERPSIESPSDGATHTILFSENLQSGKWTSGDWREIGFAGIVDRERVRAAVEAAADPAESQARWLKVYEDSATDPAKQQGRINNTLTADVGHTPRPSSCHTGSVNVVFMDGRAMSISEQIDQGIYLRLLTGSGEDYGQQAIDDDF